MNMYLSVTAIVCIVGGALLLLSKGFAERCYFRDVEKGCRPSGWRNDPCRVDPRLDGYIQKEELEENERVLSN